jgi:hypothetical protein
MPYVGDGDDFQSARKRRWDDDHDGSVYRLYNPDKLQQPDIYLFNPSPDFAAPRKTLPLSSKRARITPNDDASHHHSPNTFAPTHRRRASQQKILQEQSGLGNRASVPLSAALLLPCHICHRRPTKKCDLDSFAGCQGCGERACFVCIRLCHGCNADDGMSVLSEQEVLSRSFHMDDDADEPLQADDEQDHHGDRHDDTRSLYKSYENGGRDGTKGWAASGHRSVVCSRCCVERGPEGEVVCLGCLSGMPGA